MSAGTLVDSNVLLDIFTEDATWLEWSTESLGAAAEAGPLYINPVIYAEVSVRFSRIEDLEDALPPADFRRAALPWTAAFLAGKAFVSHRRARGSASAPLPDFFIGAHTAVDDLALLTRDGRRYPQVLPDRPASDARALMSTLLTGAAVQATLNAIARSHELIVGAAILTGIREKLISALESDS